MRPGPSGSLPAAQLARAGMLPAPSGLTSPVGTTLRAAERSGRCCTSATIRAVEPDVSAEDVLPPFTETGGGEVKDRWRMR